MEAAGSFKTLRAEAAASYATFALIYQTTGYYNPIYI
jgi:hypothetical protein